MCGIAGIADPAGINAALLHEMSQLLKHRGPDDEGFLLLNDQRECYSARGKDTVTTLNLPTLDSLIEKSPSSLVLLHRRLSILDLSDSGHQPMSYAGGNIHIAFNGEVYNYLEIKKELEILGERFNTSTDTEVILRAYLHWGKDCVHRFMGMWAFVILDLDKNILFLSRDRFGIKPLYYANIGNTFAFSSEIKALLPITGTDVALDSALQYISFGALSNLKDVMFSSIQQLQPGHHLIYDLKTRSISTQKYYDLNDAVDKVSYNEKDVFDRYAWLLQQSVQMHLRSDVRVGSALSGGLDSSTLVAIAAKMLGYESFQTYTAAYREREFDESGYANLVRKQYSNIESYFTYPDAKGYWADIRKMIWHQDLPIQSTSMFAQWEVMKLAHSNNTKVLLDGQGADESLGGYYNFAGVFLLDLLRKGRLMKYRHEKKQLRENFTAGVNTAMIRALYYYLPESLQREVRKRKRIGMDSIEEKYSSLLTSIEVPARGATSYRELSVNSTLFSMQDLLRYEDRNSMAFSIESRVPFLDHRLVEFSIALKSDLKIRDGWTKYILRKTAEPLLPAELVWRKDKMGFLTPQQLWLSQSQEQIRQMLNEMQVPEFLNRKKLIERSQSLMSDASQLSELWKIISFIQWANIFKVKFTGKEL